MPLPHLYVPFTRAHYPYYLLPDTPIRLKIFVNARSLKAGGKNLSGKVMAGWTVVIVLTMGIMLCLATMNQMSLAAAWTAFVNIVMMIVSYSRPPLLTHTNPSIS